MNTFLEVIKAFDVRVLTFIQDYLAPGFLYPVMDFFAKEENAIYAGVAIFPVLFFLKGKKAFVFLVMLALSIALTDQTTYFLKRTFSRARPNQVSLPLEQQTQKRSFPSAHAANITGAYFVIRFFWPLLRFPMIGIVFLVIYGRLYLNKHYPTDVLVGFLIGVFISAFLLKVTLPFLLRRFPKLQEWLKSKTREVANV